jgi:hypothetical protein
LYWKGYLTYSSCFSPLSLICSIVEDNKTMKAQLLQCKNIIHVYVLLEITHLHIPPLNRPKHHIF